MSQTSSLVASMSIQIRSDAGRIAQLERDLAEAREERDHLLWMVGCLSDQARSARAGQLRAEEVLAAHLEQCHTNEEQPF